jgi:hypothetical protein
MSRIEEAAFSETGLVEITVRSSVDVCAADCSSGYRSLCPVAFHSGSRLSRIESVAFDRTGFVEIIFSWTD